MILVSICVIVVFVATAVVIVRGGSIEGELYHLLANTTSGMTTDALCLHAESSGPSTERALRRMQQRNDIVPTDQTGVPQIDQWQLTQAGLERAEEVSHYRKSEIKSLMASWGQPSYQGHRFWS